MPGRFPSSNREAAFVALGFVLVCVLAAGRLAWGSLEKTARLQARNVGWLISSADYRARARTPAGAHGSGALLLDGDPRTALTGLNAHGVATLPRLFRPNRDFTWRTDLPFIQLQLALTHTPARPPQAAPPRRLRLWPGHQATARTYREYARPRRVRLVFFTQQLVDFDREYRLPDMPEFAYDQVITLADRPGVQEIPLALTKYALPSTAFPRAVRQIYMRLEILDYYPGARFPRDLAFSEIAVAR